MGISIMRGRVEMIPWAALEFSNWKMVPKRLPRWLLWNCHYLEQWSSRFPEKTQARIDLAVFEPSREP